MENRFVDLKHGSVDGLPFESDTFDKAMAINSMQIWWDAVAGLRQMRRVLKSWRHGRTRLYPYSGQPSEGLTEKIMAARFTQAHVVEKDKDICALALKP